MFSNLTHTAVEISEINSAVALDDPIRLSGHTRTVTSLPASDVDVLDMQPGIK